ncbi:MAG: lysylphosphatidylglycerol synthase domain-containing protein [Actinomycetota bacterium]
MTATRRRITGFIGIAIGLLGLVFVIIRLARDWDVVTDALAAARWPLVFLALVVVIAGMTIIGLNWHSMLRDAGGPSAPQRASLHQYFVGQLGKYVPGGVWPIVGRAEMAHRGGASRTAAYGSTLLSLGSTYLASLMTAATFMAIVGLRGGGSSWAVWLVLVVPIGLLLLHPQVVSRVVSLVSRVFGRTLDLPIASWQRSVTIVVLHLPAWLAISAATYLVSQALGGGASFDRIGVATCVAWFLGFVVIGLPGGLGVREAVFVALTTPMDPAIAAAVALVSRVVFVVVDLVGAGLSTGWQLTRSQRKIET